MQISNLEGIIFDLDGTLWDSSKEVGLVWSKVFGSQPDIESIPDEKDIRSIMGLSADDIMKKLYPDLSRQRGRELMAACEREEQLYLAEHGASLYEGVEALLRKLAKHIALYIVSNCNSGYIESFFAAHDMEKYFKDWECAGDTGLSKSENISLIMKRNNIKRAVYVGDTIWDYQAASTAGIPFVHAAYGFGELDDVPKISSPFELAKLLEVID